MSPELIKQQFYELGYVHLPDFFSHATMDHLSGVIFDHFGEKPAWEHDNDFIGDAKVEVVPWFPQREGVTDFDEVESNSEFIHLTDTLLGPGWNTQYCMVMFSKAGTAGQAWHQDCPPENPSQFNINRLVYTDDIVDEIGGQILVMPGSHKRGELTVGEPHEDFAEQVMLKPKKGDLIFLHGHCWHRIMPIKTKYRFSTNFRAAPSGVPEDITDVCVYRNMKYRFSTSEKIEIRT